MPEPKRVRHPTVSAADRGGRIRTMPAVLWMAAGLIFLSAARDVAHAQAADQAEGTTMGNYNVQQSIELGYRFADTVGSSSVYDTFLNLQQGPRILSQSLFATSLNHQGSLFDSASFNSVGWGGDPENTAFLRLSKNKWYDFSAVFRRYQNFWDYNLFANPLNPPNSNPDVPMLFSPHSFQTRRRMSDLDLTLLPQSRVSFRLGYSRNRSEGPSLSSLHVGTEALLFQDWNNTTNQYRIGADIKLLPQTSISYDQFLQYDKGDTDYFDQNLLYQLSNGTPADLGLTWATPSAPCATPILDSGTNPPTANPTCNGFLQYSRLQRARTFTPTEQLTIVSSYIPRVNFVARVGYSNAQLNTPLTDMLLGRESRTNLAESITTGSVSNNRVAAWTDLGVTIRVSRRLSIEDKFRYDNFHIPGLFNMAQTNFYSPTSPGSMLDPPCPATPTTCAQHTGSSAADIIGEPFIRFLGQNEKWNQIDLRYEFNKRFGAHVGYRFRHRFVHNRFLDVATETFFPTLPNRGDCAGVNLNPDGSCSVVAPPDAEDNPFDINEHTALVGIWARPVKGLRVNFDLEAMNADNFLTRVSPRHEQRYRLNTIYQPKAWATLSFGLNLVEDSNGVTEIDYRGHNRYYTFSTTLMPRERFGLNLSYSFNDLSSGANICFVETPATAGAGTCVEDPTQLQMFSSYQSNAHYGNASVIVKPIKRVTTQLGYSITSVDGSALLLNGLEPGGPLRFNYHQPIASLSVDLAQHVSWNAEWNYDQYKEKTLVGPTAPRYFHDNRATISLRYAF
jgi:hypothetical protein